MELRLIPLHFLKNSNVYYETAHGLSGRSALLSVWNNYKNSKLLIVAGPFDDKFVTPV